MEVLPLFKSHYSLGKSILTLEKPDDTKDNGPDSIIKIAKDNKLENLFLVEDNMSGFLQAYLNCLEEKIKLIFGLRLSVGTDKLEKSEESLKKFCKFIVFAKNEEGYKRLIKIYSDASINGFYYTPRTDYSSLKENWDSKDLELCIPFYDSFIFKNVLEGYACVPEISFAEPTLFVEDNDLPFDNILRKKIIEYTENKYQVTRTKSIYYNLKEHFSSYLTFRCISKRSTLEKPQLEHMCSDEFCFESWKNDR